MLKKILSLSLITLILFQAIHFNLCTSYASWGSGSGNKAKQGIEDVCKKKYFEDITEASNCGVIALKGNEGSFSRMNISSNKDTDLWMWDYVQIDNAVIQLNKKVEKTKKEITKDKVISLFIDTFKALFKIDDNLAEQALDKWVNETEILNLSIEPKEKVSAKSTFKKELKSHSLWRGIFGFVGSVAPHVAAHFFPGVREYVWASWAWKAGSTLVGGAAGYVGGHEAANIHDVYVKDEKIQKNLAIVKSYSSAFEQLLAGITHEMWKNGDILRLIINHDVNDYEAKAEFLSKGIHYTKANKNSFESTFNRLKKSLNDIVIEGKEKSTVDKLEGDSEDKEDIDDMEDL